MKHEKLPIVPLPEDVDQIIEPVDFTFGLKRRSFVQLVATGLMIAAAPMPSFAQQRGGGRRGGGFGGAQIRNVWERVHIGKDGVVTLLAGKVEVGQGSRAEYTQAAAEELRVPANQIQLVMSDTGLTPNDGNTAGSGSTPRTVPAIRAACAAAREALIDLAAQRWGVERGTVELRDGKLTHGESKRTLAFGELAQGDGLQKAFEEAAPAGGKTTEVKDWKVLGTSVPRPNARDLITGGHRYPSDIKRPDMLRGKVLRPPSYGAKLTSIDLTPAKEMKNVVAMQDGDFVGVAAPTTLQAEQALAAIAKTAKWETAPHPSSKAIYDHLRERVPGGAPKNSFAEELAAAKNWRARSGFRKTRCESSCRTLAAASAASTRVRFRLKWRASPKLPANPCPSSGRGRRNLPGLTSGPPRLLMPRRRSMTRAR